MTTKPMTRSCIALVSVLATATALAAQAVSSPAFEVAAVSPVAQNDETRNEILSGSRRSGMIVTDARIDISYLSLGQIVRRAFDVPAYAFSAPPWLEELRFDIQATIPSGRRQEDVPAMLQSLLVERFGMATHRESREVPSLVLVVGNNGPRLRNAAPESSAPSGERASVPGTNVTSGGSGKPFTLKMETEKNGTMLFTRAADGGMEIFIPKTTMTELATNLTGIMGQPVFDRTGLTGSYELTLMVSADDVTRILPPGMTGGALAGAAGPASAASEPRSPNSIVTSIDKVGLKLESRRMPVEVVVVDRMDRTAKPN